MPWPCCFRACCPSAIDTSTVAWRCVTGDDTRTCYLQALTSRGCPSAAATSSAPNLGPALCPPPPLQPTNTPYHDTTHTHCRAPFQPRAQASLTHVPDRYMGEDPHLAGKMAAAETVGIMSEGVVACAKHWVDNNQEGPGHNGRLFTSSVPAAKPSPALSATPPNPSPVHPVHPFSAFGNQVRRERPGELRAVLPALRGPFSQRICPHTAI